MSFSEAELAGNPQSTPRAGQAATSQATPASNETGTFTEAELSGQPHETASSNQPSQTYGNAPGQTQDYLTKTEDIINNAETGVTKGISDLWGMVKNTPSGIYHSLPPVQLHDYVKQSLPIIDAYEKSRASGASVMDSLKAANEQAKRQDAVRQAVKKHYEEFKENPTRETARALTDATGILGTIYATGGAGAEGEEGALESEVSTLTPVAETEVATEPGIIRQIVQGERVSQPQAGEAIRTAANAGSKEGGVTTVQPQSLRELASQPIDSLTAKAKASYRVIDDAAGTDFKALNEKLENTEYQIRNLTETEEDLAKEGALEKSRQGIIDKIAQARQAAIDNGVDPKLLDEADQQFTQAQALRDVEARVFKNPSVVKGNVKFKTPETVDVDAAIKTLQRLQDNEKYGAPRLEQALGKEGADGLLKDLYEAQRAGQTALKRQQFAKMVAKYVGLSAGVAYGGHLLHALGE